MCYSIYWNSCRDVRRVTVNCVYCTVSEFLNAFGIFISNIVLIIFCLHTMYMCNCLYCKLHVKSKLHVKTWRTGAVNRELCLCI
jgi:hypothetical protein